MATPLTCPVCGGPGLPLGTLGKRSHFRCQDCGIDFSDSPLGPGEQPSPEAAQELLELIGGGEPEGDEVTDALGMTDCQHGCMVEPDGTCPHGYRSAALTLGVI
jgi:hypothetical protein